VNRCYFLDNPSDLLPSEINVCGIAIPINSEKLTNCSHLGLERLVQARCRICPYNFECECTYSDTNLNEALELGNLIINFGKDFVETASRALNELREKLTSIVSECLTILILCPSEINLMDFERLTNTLIKEFDADMIAMHTELTEIEETVILIFIWIKKLRGLSNPRGNATGFGIQ